MSGKHLGILGGMGAHAGACLLQKVLDRTPARVDQEHLEILLYSNPGVPDRTRSILGTGESAEPELLRSVRLLERCGVQCIIIACVTSHHYIDTLRAAVEPTILSIVEETAALLARDYAGRTRSGLLATSGTVRAGFIQQELRRRGLETLVPTEEDQGRLVMSAIYGERGIKAGFLDEANREKLRRAAERLVERGAEVLVAGCTEIPLVLEGDVRGVPVVDMMDALAAGAVAFCREGR